MGLDMEQVVTAFPGNIMLSAEEDGSLCEPDIVDRLGSIILVPRMSCIMKLKQMDLKSTLLNRFLNVEV